MTAVTTSSLTWSVTRGESQYLAIRYSLHLLSSLLLKQPAHLGQAEVDPVIVLVDMVHLHT